MLMALRVLPQTPVPPSVSLTSQAALRGLHLAPSPSGVWFSPCRAAAGDRRHEGRGVGVDPSAPSASCHGLGGGCISLRL